MINMGNSMPGFLQISKENNDISCKTYHILYWVGSEPKALCGLTESHNFVIDKIPSFHTILSAIGTPAYKLAKVFIFLIEP